MKHASPILLILPIRIKSNMRCIETLSGKIVEGYDALIKSNMRCIETQIGTVLSKLPPKIKSNMRCIETSVVSLM